MQTILNFDDTSVQLKTKDILFTEFQLYLHIPCAVCVSFAFGKALLKKTDIARPYIWQ